jgi:membrane fusion protein (multidrug efflux system)
MNKRSSTLLVIIVITVLLVIGAIGLRKYRMQRVDNLPIIGQASWALHVEKVKLSNVTKGFPVLATLTGSTEITISSQLSGTIEKMGPREGIKVKKGELLASISVQELQQQYAGIEQQKEVALAEEKRTKDEYQRQKSLIKQGLTTQQSVDEKHTAAISATKQVATVAKQLSALKVRIQYGTVLVPRNAIIAAKLAETGDIAQPGKPLYKLTVDSAARLNVQLPQQILEQIHPQTKIILTHGSLQKVILLSRIFPSLNANALGTAEADIDSMPFALPSGARIPARVILVEKDEVLTVPHRAIIVNGDVGVIFKVVSTNNEPRLIRVKVKILLEGNNGVAVSGDLTANDKVVVAHQSMLMRLKNNDLVTISVGGYNDL